MTLEIPLTPVERMEVLTVIDGVDDKRHVFNQALLDGGLLVRGEIERTAGF